ncbi:MAG: hypothetical protein U0350_02040 [Caldilineaceae bacterium]
MAIDGSKMLREFPFSQLVLPNDETVILTDDNWAFDRSDLQAVLISNKALYLGWTWQDRAKWRGFPLTEIECATLRSREYSVVRLLLETGLCLFVFVILCWFAFAIWGIAGVVNFGIYGGPVLWVILSFYWEEIKNPHTPPCALRIEEGKKNYTWHMPADDYANEIDHDCWMVRRTLDKLAELGVKTATEL